MYVWIVPLFGNLLHMGPVVKDPKVKQDYRSQVAPPPMLQNKNPDFTSIEQNLASSKGKALVKTYKT